MTTSTICPTCGAPKSPRSAQCQHCHLTAIAPLGFKATVAKFGVKFGVKFVQEHLNSHPSDLEVIVSSWLRDLGVQFQTNFWVEDAQYVYLVDFAVETPNGTVMVEVDGSWCHQFHADRDARKHAALTDKGYTVVHLDTTAVKSGSGRQTLEAVL